MGSPGFMLGHDIAHQTVVVVDAMTVGVDACAPSMGQETVRVGQVNIPEGKETLREVL